MKLADLANLTEASSKSINDDILNHNLKSTFDETSKEINDQPYEGNKKKIDKTAGKKPKVRNGSDRVLFKEAVKVSDDESHTYLKNRAKKKAPLKKMKKDKDLKEQMMGDPEAYDREEDLEVPDMPNGKQKAVKATESNPIMVITHEGKNGQVEKMLGGKYSDYNKLKRIFSNFYKLILSDKVSGNFPKIIKYTENSLMAAVDGNDGEYLIKIKDLPGFTQVKDFNQFLKTGLA